VAKARNDILFRLLSDTKSLERGNRRAKKSLLSVEGAAKRLGGVVALAFGAREISQFAGDALKAAISYEESLNAVEVATGSAAKAIFEIGETSAESLGIGKLAVNEAAVAFAGFARQIDENNVAGTFDELLTRATDFASVFEIEVSEALQIFQSTLAGQSRPIRRFGRDTSDASVKVFALANGIGEVGREMTEGEKVQARYGLLLQETADVAGDFANTLDSTANQQKIANEQMEDAKILLGNELIPLQRDWVNIQRKLVIPALISVTGELGRITDGYEKVGEGIGNVSDSSLTFVDRMLGVGKSAIGVADALSFFLAPGMKQTQDAINDAAAAGKEELVPVMSDLADTTVTYRDTLPPLVEELEEVVKSQEELAEAAGKTLGAYQASLDSDVFARYAKAVNSLFGIGADLQLEIDAAKGRARTGAINRGSGGVLEGFATGGTVGGPKGKAQLAVVHGGERVSTPGNDVGGGVTINFNGVVTDPVAVAQEIQDLLDLNARVNGTFT